jgi:hypothetical protein
LPSARDVLVAKSCGDSRTARRIARGELRDDRAVSAGWEVLIQTTRSSSADGVSTRPKSYYGNAFIQDYRRTGWTKSE